MNNLKALLNLADREDIADEHADTFTKAAAELTRLQGLEEALQTIATVAAGTWAGNYAKIVLNREG